MINIKIGNKEYKVKEAKTERELQTGLQYISSLPDDEGMLFYFDPPQDATFWMDKTLIPLDIIFINEDQEVIYIYQGEPKDRKKVTVPNTAFVLEVNKDSGIKDGDELEFLDDNDEGPVMQVLSSDGNSQVNLWGGERIFSRKHTKILIKKAKKADQTKEAKDYKALGRYMFKCLKHQQEQSPEYVQLPN